MDAAEWDAKYSAKDLVYGLPPNGDVVEFTTSLTRGRALDLACGEGRNALWLATRGWEVTAVDFSTVALTKGHRIASSSPRSVRERLTWVQADVTEISPKPEYDLVLVLYLHLPSVARRKVIQNAIDALKPDGILMISGHHSDNLTLGVGGPQDAEILYTPEDLAADTGGRVMIRRCEERVRNTDRGNAIDSLLLASKSGLGSGNERG
jgi:2-polyprenyl-3-methyl-5-hydroxy-6-metoxy-1,4-benzoquinol methylase